MSQPNPHMLSGIRILDLTRAVIRPLEVLRRVTPGMNQAVTQLGRYLFRANVEGMLAGKEPGFEAKRASAAA